MAEQVKSHRILVLTRYGRKAASSRLRHLLYIPFLESRGFSFTVNELLPDTYVDALYCNARYSRWQLARHYLRRAVLLLSRRRFDLLWIEKELFPFLPFWCERMLLGNSRFIVDFDDQWVLRYKDSAPRMFTRIWLNKLPRLARTASIVTVSNDVLKEHFTRYGASSVRVLRGSIPVRDYRLRSSKVTRSPEPGAMRVGWIGTPVTAAKYLPPIVPILNRLSEAGLIRVVLIGAGHAVPELLSERMEWSEDTEVESIASLDIGVMPLPQGAFEEAKSGHKLVQYMACGKPFVASPIGINVELARDSGAGLLATDDEAWSEAITRLAHDESLRQKMGEAGFSYVEKCYDIHDRVKEIEAVFTNILLSRPGSAPA